MILPAVAIAISAATGWFVVGGIWREPSRSLGYFILRLSVSFGLGLFVSSLVYFACLISGLTRLPFVVSCDALTLIAAYLFFRSQSASRQIELPDLSEFAALPLTWRRTAITGIGAGLGIHVLAWHQRHAEQPMGFWDAFTIWNLKARFFYLEGGVEWQRAFHSAIEWSHTDYPLLLPLNVARLWVYGGEAEHAISASLSAIFALLAIATVFGAIAIARGMISALLATFALLAAPEFMGQSVWQIADIPMGYFLVASLAVVAASGREAGSRQYLLAGLLAGAAAWTKNEGSLVALSILIGILCFAPGERLHERLASSGRYLAGLVLPLACVVAMKSLIGGDSDLAAGITTESLARIFDLARHQSILASFVSSLLTLTGLPLIALLVGLWFWFGAASHRDELPILGIASLALALQLSGYYLIYLTTSRDLAWHLGTSNLRLLVQLWPSAVLLLFVAMRPVKAAADKEGRV